MRKKLRIKNDLSKTKNLKNYYKKNNGITLIVLSITIIVMLILVGVTIRSAFGDEGVINEAKGTANSYIYGQEQEENTIGNLNNKFLTNRKRISNDTNSNN